ncbi:MAG: RsbRD N-terminal domain-containing protein [Bilophila sp.]
MSAEDFVSARREQAIRAWTDAVYAMYPFETTGFIRTQKDRFANPVGHATVAAAGEIYNAVCGQDVAMDTVHGALAELIRIRAVQDMRPEQAVGVLFLLKPVLRELFLVDMLASGKLDDYLEMESRLDSLVLIAFGMYVADREQVYAERVSEQRRGGSQLARWAARHGMTDA